MVKAFNSLLLNTYTNFMRYTISSPTYNILLTLAENIPIIMVIDLIFSGDVLAKVFTPFYFLSPHLYLDLLNEQFPNECSTVISYNQTNTDENSTSTNSTINLIQFFNTTIITADTSFCLYSSTLIYISAIMSVACVAAFFLIGFISNRDSKKSVSKKIALFISTNFVNVTVRPFSVLIYIVLFNRPIIMLYESSMINSGYYTREVLLTVLCIIVLVVFTIFSTLYIKYINNSYYFENFPFDSNSVSDSSLITVIKIFIGCKINFDKLSGFRRIAFVDLIIGILILLRFIFTIFNKPIVINQPYLRTIRHFFAYFCIFEIVIRLINKNIDNSYEVQVSTVMIELVLMFITLIALMVRSKVKFKFVFDSKENFEQEILNFLYYTDKYFLNSTNYNTATVKKENFIDNIIIGHKMKCSLDGCIICREDIFSPDLQTFFIILYNQFLKFEKEMKEEEDEDKDGTGLLIKIMILRVLDQKKMHRVALMVLKNSKVSLETNLKMFYVYYKMLDGLNLDLKNLLTIKYGEVYSELLKVVGCFEEIFGFVRSRTEKVELVINKTNKIGSMYNQIVKDLHFLKKNKRVYFDMLNMLQLVCVVKLLFQKNLDAQLTDNLENNFADFLENIDKVFEENISFIIKYDFINKAWRITKIPKKFVDVTRFKVDELIDQSIEKIFPRFLSKYIVKKLEEMILLNVVDQNIIFKTFVSDRDTNIKYVKFDIDIIPNLSKNYMIVLNCHFHKRELLIIDDKGNFINGSENLYKKMGITSEIVQASKGKINMYNVFKLDKNAKLEEIKIVSISKDNLIDTTKKVFLLESTIQGNIPNFLTDLLTRDKTATPQKNLVYLNLFDTLLVNNGKYFVYTIKINIDDDKSDDENKTDFPLLKTQNFHSITPANRVHESSSSFNSERKPNKMKHRRGSEPEAGDNINTYHNYLDYYNYFYDTHRSASVTVDYNAYHNHSNHSHTMSVDSDLFSFLFLRAQAKTAKRSNVFERFLYSIYISNMTLLILGLFIIIYINSFYPHSMNFTTTYYNFNKMRARIYSTTAITLSYLRYNDIPGDNAYLYNNYIQGFTSSDLDVDSYYNTVLRNHSDYILSDIKTFKNSAYTLFGSDMYFNFEANFAYFSTIGKYTVTEKESFTNTLDFFTIVANNLANNDKKRPFFNISYINFDTITNKLSYVNVNSISNQEVSYFQDLLYLYQFLFNYFSSYYEGLSSIDEAFFTENKKFNDNLSTQIRTLLIIMIVLHIAFVLVSLFSIIIYRRILLSEFNTLYSLNEEHINKVKEKFKCVKELIKSEKFPSKIYAEIRKMREIEANNNQMNSIKKKKNQLKQDTISKKSGPQTDNSAKGTDIYMKYTGSYKNLLRSETRAVQEVNATIKNQQNQAKASVYLLSRLNFEFEFIRNYIVFITMMIAFYIALAILAITTLNKKFENATVNADYSRLFFNKHAELYNYIIASKMSIMMNRQIPIIIDPDIANMTISSNFSQNILDKYYNASNEMDYLEASYPYFNSIHYFDDIFQGDKICSNLQTIMKEVYTDANQNATNFQAKLALICGTIPIFQSNLDSILTNMIMSVREIYSSFVDGQKSEQFQRALLDSDFKLTDLLLLMFTEPYFYYVEQNILTQNVKSAIDDYYSFTLICFIILVVIDFFMLFVIWFKIYKQIIKFVNNVQIVTDSVSTL